MKTVALGVMLLWGCGSSSYVVQRGTEQLPVLPAVAEDSGATVHVASRKMRVGAAEPLDDIRLRVRPKRPLALIISGSLVSALGVGMTAGGLAGLLRPGTPNAPESGGSYGDGIVLAFGCASLIAGGVPLIVGAARWSPEVQ
jgi:hypothetical protein